MIELETLESYQRWNDGKTKLASFGLTYDHVLDGERAEVEPVTKTVRKTQYVQFELSERIINAYADDLFDAYDILEAQAKHIEELEAKLQEVEEKAQTSTAQLKQLMSSDAQLEEAEKLLATFEAQMDTFVSAKQNDEGTIQALRAQVEELNELKTRIPALEDHVNTVLANLRSYMDAEGLEYDDEA